MRQYLHVLVYENINQSHANEPLIDPALTSCSQKYILQHKLNVSKAGLMFLRLQSKYNLGLVDISW